MPRLFKILSFALAVIAIGMLAASCGSGNAQYRVVNAIPNTQGISTSTYFDIQMNGSTLNTGGTLSFEATFPGPQNRYQSVSSGTDTLGVFKAGQAGQAGAIPVISSALNLKGGTQYTVILAGNQSSTYPLVAQVIADTNPTPTSGNVGIRVLDASLSLASIGSVDVYALPSTDTCCTLGTGQVASGLQYPQGSGTGGSINSGYQNIGLASNLTVWVTAHSNTSEILYHSTISSLTAGQNYTLVLVDAQRGGAPPQTLFLTP